MGFSETNGILSSLVDSVLAMTAKWALSPKTRFPPKGIDGAALPFDLDAKIDL